MYSQKDLLPIFLSCRMETRDRNLFGEINYYKRWGCEERFWSSISCWCAILLLLIGQHQRNFKISPKGSSLSSSKTRILSIAQYSKQVQHRSTNKSKRWKITNLSTCRRKQQRPVITIIITTMRAVLPPRLRLRPSQSACWIPRYSISKPCTI